METSNTSTCTQEPENPSTLSRKESATSHSMQDSPASICRVPKRERQRRSKRKSAHKKTATKNIGNGGGAVEESDEKVVVEEKIAALQRIVPGGEDFAVDELFEETAEYIMALQCQVKALKYLTTFVEGSEKQKRKLGG